MERCPKPRSRDGVPEQFPYEREEKHCIPISRNAVPPVFTNDWRDCVSAGRSLCPTQRLRHQTEAVLSHGGDEIRHGVYGFRKKHRSAGNLVGGVGVAAGRHDQTVLPGHFSRLLVKFRTLVAEIKHLKGFYGGGIRREIGDIGCPAKGMRPQCPDCPAKILPSNHR